MKKKIFLFSLLFILGLSGCASYGITEEDVYAVATNAAMGTPPPPQHQTAAAALLSITLTPTPIGDDRTVDIAATMIYDNMAAGMTQQATERELAQQKAAATATAVSIQATAQRREELNAQATQGAREAATAYSQNQFATATQQAYFIEATASKDAWIAEAAATERSWQITATVDAQLLALDLQNMATQQAAEAIRLEGESRQIELAVERQQIKNKADAILPWTLVIAALIVAGGMAYSASKIKEFKRNPDGTFNLPALQDKKGGWTIFRPDLLPMFGASIGNDGVIDYQAPEDREEQAEVTRRSQAVEAVRALPPGRERQALEITNGAFGTGQNIADAQIEILPPGSGPAALGDVNPVLDELEGQILDE